MKRDGEYGRGAGDWRLALGAALAGVVVSLVARLMLGLLTPAEVFGDQFTRLIPTGLFALLLETFGANSKHLYVAVVFVVEGALTAGFGVVYLWARPRLARWLAGTGADGTRATVAERLRAEPRYVEGVVIALALWLLAAGLVAPALGGGFFGVGMLGGALTVALSLAAPDVTFGLALVWLKRRAVEQSAQARLAPMMDGAALSRRRLLGQVGAATVVVGGLAASWAFLSGGLDGMLGGLGRRQPALQLGGDAPVRITPPPTPVYGAWTDVAGLAPEVTATQDFYYVSKNYVSDPMIDTRSWQLSIGGQVEAPYSLSYEALQALPTVERYHTLECISNQIGGDLMSTAQFVGVSLADVLNKASIKPGMREVVFRAADGYSDRLHLSQALDPRSLIVYRINGAALPHEHGFPARLLIPGLYGMKNGKWLQSLDVDAGDYTGYWEERGWTREAHVKTMTRIDTPHDGDLVVRRQIALAGVAYAADRGIARVDVSVDGGRTWEQATLRTPLGALTWTLWEYLWTPPTSGTYTIVARAVDLGGYVQTSALADPIPDGASGYHAITLVTR